MRTDHFYRVVIVILLLLNMGTLGYLYISNRGGLRGHEGHPPPPDRMIIERLKLDDKQIEQFNGLKHEHHSQMVDIQGESSKLHQELFGLLQTPATDSVKMNSLLQFLAANNQRKEMVTFEHFSKLRAILRPEQQKEFDGFVEELSQRIMGPHRAGPPPGERP